MAGVDPSPERPSAVQGMSGPWVAALTLWNLGVYAAWLVVPFVLARSATWQAGWLHLGVIVVASAAESRFVARRNPALKRRRRRIGVGTTTWDLAWNVGCWPLMASIAVVGGLQHGTDGSSLPPWTWPAGLVVVASGFVLSAWAMGTNPHFEGTVRIQADVGHRVFEGGPYRHLRHPGYLGLVLWALGTPLLLRSVWSLGPALAAAAWIVLRTALEDATLRKELPGYQDYSRRTRYRLLPGIW
jgi:protein-S-isoprenylcysteine O-methyltransferase Ste14